MKNRIVLFCSLICLLFSMIISCHKVVHVTDVTLNLPSLNLIVGGQATLMATVLPEKATNKEVIFSCTNPLVAIVTPTGTVTGLSEGNANIVVTTVDGGFTAICYVKVGEKVAVTGVTLDKEEFSLMKGDTESLIATVLPENANNKKVTFKSSNSNIASVSAQGLVKGITDGDAIITVTTDEGGFEAKCNVTVGLVSVTGVSLNKKTLELGTQDTEQLIATVLPTNATNKKVSWKSSNPNVAEVNVENGMVTAKAVGKADITVKTDDGNFEDKCNVTVFQKVYVTGVTLNKSSLTLGVGNTEQLVATVLPNNATNKNVIWSSDNTGAATVNQTGLVTAVAGGDAIITVTTEESSYTAHCSVKCISVTAPVITTLAATNITSTSSTLNGNISNVGSPAYTERGFCYSYTNSQPTIGGSGCESASVSGNGTGNYSRTVNYLKDNTTYYFRAYVKTELGVTYGNVLNFKTPSSISMVRFKKAKDYTYVTRLGVADYYGQIWASYNFGTSAGTSPYYVIPPDDYALVWYTANEYWEYFDDNYYEFKDGRKYTVTCDDDGVYFIFYVTNDGLIKSSEPDGQKINSTTIIKIPKNKIEKNRSNHKVI